MSYKRMRIVGRVALVIALLVNVWSLSIQDAGTWAWWLALSGIVFVLACIVISEISVRRTEKLRWELASQTSDPIATLAMTQYLDTLSKEQRAELRGSLNTMPHGTPFHEMPKLVQGLFRAAHGTNREDSYDERQGES